MTTLTNKRHITRDWLKALAGGTIFMARFIKKGNGELRVMRCVLGAKGFQTSTKPKSEAQLTADARHNQLTVTEVDPHGFPSDKHGVRIPEEKSRPRKISCDNILSIKAKGLHITRDSLSDCFTEH